MEQPGFHVFDAMIVQSEDATWRNFRAVSRVGNFMEYCKMFNNNNNNLCHKSKKSIEGRGVSFFGGGIPPFVPPKRFYFEIHPLKVYIDTQNGLV